MLRTFFAALLLTASSCSTAQVPKWEGKIYQAQRDALVLPGPISEHHPGLVRRQSGEIILAEDEDFDNFMAMRWSDFRSFTNTLIFSCKEWYPVPKAAGQ